MGKRRWQLMSRPRLSWQLQSAQCVVRQSAYRVLVASSEDKLARDEADIWDSERIIFWFHLHADKCEAAIEYSIVQKGSCRSSAGAFLTFNARHACSAFVPCAFG